MAELLAAGAGQRLGALWALPGRIARRAARELANSCRRWLDRRGPTTLSDRAFDALIAPARERGMDPLDWSRRLVDAAALRGALMPFHDASGAAFRRVAGEAAAHRFDLLGSGPMEVGYRTEAAGAFGGIYHMAPGPEQEKRQIARMSELLEATASFVGDDSAPLKRLRACLSDGGRPYRPIDWHLDFKSGYRWSPQTWYRDVPYGHLRGVDVKVPWELSRCHHLVALALDGATGGPREERAVEIGLQILDWIAANPPRFGVNWRDAMDVAIRAANWIWAVSIIGEADVLPPTLLWLLAKSLYQHAVHIETHLDYDPRGTNHYLADLTGLMYVAAAFPEFPESPRWLAFCLRELVREMGRAVYPDGVNHEASTGYHRLVTEMFVHGTLLACRLSPTQRVSIASSTPAGNPLRPRPLPLPDPEFDLGVDTVFPEWFLQRLNRMLGYVSDVTKPNGLAVQFGDQDSGRFVKFNWAGRGALRDELAEEPRDHRHLLAVGARLFGVPHWGADGREYALDGLLMTLGIAGLPLATPRETPGGCTRMAAPREQGAPESIWYPSGGTCVMRCGRMWAAVRCVPADSRGPGGHRHNDQLSFELNVVGEDVVVDWGSGVYTADREVRNHLRRTRYHSTVDLPGQEQNRLTEGRAGVFALRDRTNARCVEVEAGRFVGEHQGFGVRHRRTISLREDAMVVEDTLSAARDYRVTLTLAEGVTPELASDGSGLVLKAGLHHIALSIHPPGASPTVEPGSLASGYGAFRDACAVRFEGRRGSSVLTLRIHSPDGGPP